MQQVVGNWQCRVLVVRCVICSGGGGGGGGGGGLGGGGGRGGGRLSEGYHLTREAACCELQRLRGGQYGEGKGAYTRELPASHSNTGGNCYRTVPGDGCLLYPPPPTVPGDGCL